MHVGLFQGGAPGTGSIQGSEEHSLPLAVISQARRAAKGSLCSLHSWTCPSLAQPQLPGEGSSGSRTAGTGGRDVGWHRFGVGILLGSLPPDPAAPVPRDSHPSPLPFPAPPGCPHARPSWGRGPAGFLPAGPRLLCGRAGCPSGGRGHRGARGPCVSTAATFKTQRRGGRGGSGSRARRDVGAGAAAGARHPRGPAAAARPARQPAQGGRVLPQQLPAGQGTDRAG